MSQPTAASLMFFLGNRVHTFPRVLPPLRRTQMLFLSLYMWQYMCVCLCVLFALCVASVHNDETIYVTLSANKWVNVKVYILQRMEKRERKRKEKHKRARCTQARLRHVTAFCRSYCLFALSVFVCVCLSVCLSLFVCVCLSVCLSKGLISLKRVSTFGLVSVE